jgi:hypothetical protein
MIDLRTPITLRSARLEDRAALIRLAALDSATVPPAPLLIAEVDGELKVAMSVLDGATIADPFSPTAEIVELLHARVKRVRPRPAWPWAVRPWTPRPWVVRPFAR